MDHEKAVAEAERNLDQVRGDLDRIVNKFAEDAAAEIGGKVVPLLRELGKDDPALTAQLGENGAAMLILQVKTETPALQERTRQVLSRSGNWFHRNGARNSSGHELQATMDSHPSPKLLKTHLEELIDACVLPFSDLLAERGFFGGQRVPIGMRFKIASTHTFAEEYCTRFKDYNAANDAVEKARKELAAANAASIWDKVE